MNSHKNARLTIEGRKLLIERLCTVEPAIIEALSLERLRSGMPLAVPHRALRYRLEPGRTEAAMQQIGTAFDLPMVHGAYWTRRRARRAWAAAFDPQNPAPMLDRTIKLDLDAACVLATWQRLNATQLEPLFVERPGSTDEEDGVLLVPTLANDDAGTVIGVVDPASMACLATLHLPQVVPFGFHAAWNGASSA